MVAEIRQIIEDAAPGSETHLTDLHVWRVGRDVYACALTAVPHDAALTPDDLRTRLAIHDEIVHATIELHHCAQPCAEEATRS